MTIVEIEQLLKLGQQYGVVSLSLGELSIRFGEQPAPSDTVFVSQVPIVPEKLELSDEDMLFYSVVDPTSKQAEVLPE